MTQPQTNEERLQKKRESNRRWREANRERHDAYNREYGSSRRTKESKRKRCASALRNRAYILAAKDRPCVDCGCQLLPKLMHFDHVKGEKLFQLGGNAARRSLAMIKAEMEKCEVRCIVCHGIRHGGRIENLKSWTPQTP